MKSTKTFPSEALLKISTSQADESFAGRPAYGVAFEYPKYARNKAALSVRRTEAGDRSYATSIPQFFTRARIFWMQIEFSLESPSEPVFPCV